MARPGADIWSKTKAMIVGAAGEAFAAGGSGATFGAASGAAGRSSGPGAGPEAGAGSLATMSNESTVW